MPKILIHLFYLYLLAFSVSPSPSGNPPKPKDLNKVLEITDQDFGYRYENKWQIWVGNPYQALKIKITTTFCGLFLYDKGIFGYGFDTQVSKTFTSRERDGKIKYHTGVLATDYVEVTKYSVLNFPFIVINSSLKPDETTDGELGWGYNCGKDDTDPTKYSEDVVFHLISSENHDPHGPNLYNLFYIWLDNDGGGKIQFGRYPTEIDHLPNKFYYKQLPIARLANHNQWETMLHSVFFKDSVILNVNQYISIGISGLFISVNKKMFEFIIHKFFIDDLDFHFRCKLEKKEVHEIYCNDDFNRESIGDISFVLDNITFKIPAKNLFYPIKNKKEFRNWFAIVYYPGKDRFYISQKMLRNTLLVYDKHNNSIGMILPNMITRGPFGYWL